jgi:hypothetical protein
MSKDIPDPILCKGDVVLANNGERTIEARVTIASPNGRSLVIVWADGMLGGYVGMMPVLYDDGEYRGLIDGMCLTLTRKEA